MESVAMTSVLVDAKSTITLQAAMPVATITQVAYAMKHAIKATMRSVLDHHMVITGKLWI